MKFALLELDKEIIIQDFSLALDANGWHVFLLRKKRSKCSLCTQLQIASEILKELQLRNAWKTKEHLPVHKA